MVHRWQHVCVDVQGRHDLLVAQSLLHDLGADARLKSVLIGGPSGARDFSSAMGPGQLWRDYMKEALDGVPATDWERPANVVQATEQLGHHAGRGNMTTGVVEYQTGLAIFANVSADAKLLIMLRPRTNVGPLLYDLARHRAEIAGLL